MKEITRIHIAKQAYEIELSAKKDLEKKLGGAVFVNPIPDSVQPALPVSAKTHPEK